MQLKVLDLSDPDGSLSKIRVGDIITRHQIFVVDEKKRKVKQPEELQKFRVAGHSTNLEGMGILDLRPLHDIEQKYCDASFHLVGGENRIG